MKKNKNCRLAAGLDIGTSKIVAIIGEVYPDNSVKVLGWGRCPSQGLKRGMVINVDETVSSIKEAVGDAQVMSGLEIRSINTGIAGAHIQGQDLHGMARFKGQVDQATVDKAIDSARAIDIPSNQKILHTLVREFVIDSHHNGIHYPIGISGKRLDSYVYLITSSLVAVQNIETCINRCGLVMDEVILEQLASSYAVLTDDERKFGICLVDIGAGTTDIAIFAHGALVYSKVIPVAGDDVTHDIALGLRTPHRSAEQIKISYGCVDHHSVGREDMIEVSGIGRDSSSQLSQSTLVDIIRPRYEALLEQIQQEVEKSGHSGDIAAGYVLCGGSAQVHGLRGLAEGIFNLPIRIGFPEGVTSAVGDVCDPSFATSLGLLKCDPSLLDSREGNSRGLTRSFISTMKSWFGIPK